MAYSDCTRLGKFCLKRKRSSILSHELTPQQEEDRNQESTKRRHTWENLDLILALQSKELHLERKLKEAFDFASLEARDSAGHLQSVSFSRALRYVCDWTQSIMMYSERKRKDEEILNPCLDHRCWAIIKLCLEKSSPGVSPNLFRAVTPVLKKALLLLDSNSTLDGVESMPLFENVFKCLSLLLSSNSRAFYNVGVDLWISCAADVLNVISKVSSREEQGSSVAKTLLDLSALLLEHFATFLRFHPNPKNIFRVFIEGLLEQLFDLLVLLQLRAKEGYLKQFASMLKIVEDVMLNGLFHPAHICGFLSSITAGQEGESRGVNESYHRHLFRKLEKVIREKKVTALGGFGCFLRLFSSRARGQQASSLSFRGLQVLKKGNEVTGDAQEASIPLFEVFMQFIKPLLQECKRSVENELSRTTRASPHMLIELHCMLKSLNETLKSFIQENVYVRTEDTPEGKHYCFLKEIYDTIYSISIKVLSFWSLELSQRKSDDEVKKMLPLIAREIVVGFSYFLEIEYRVFGDNLVIVWRMLLSFMAANLSITNSMPCTLLKNEILTLGCRLINVYSELRQVSTPLFSLCKAMRFLINTSDITDEYKISSSSIQSSQLYLEAAKSMFTSQELRLTIAKAVNSVPEGQAGGCLQQLNIDVADALEWIRRSSLPMVRKPLDEQDEQANVYMVDMDVQTEVLGRVLSELYATILESLSVTAMNSTSIGNSMKSLIKTLRPSLSCFLQIQSNHVNDFVFSVTGRRSLNYSGFTEQENNSVVKAQSVCWIFLFFFRVYASSKSLYRQSISLMPPELSHKASEAMGDLFTSSCCMDWVHTPKKMNEGYFCWITKSSISLPEVISIISKVFFPSSCAAYAPLSYILQVMSIQRLNDLSRLIKAFEYFDEKDVLVNHMQLQDEIIRPKSIKKWKRLIAGPCKEASELTNFMMGYLPLFDSKGPVSEFDDDGKEKLVCEVDWDYSLFSLDEKSLHVALWWLFCQNSDVWCAHSTKKHLNKFFSYLFLFSSPSPNNHKGLVDGKVKGSSYQSVTLYRISVEYLQDTISYEQMIQYTKVSRRFCHVLKKLLSPILLHTSSNLDLDSSPNWAVLLNILEKEPVMINAAHGLGLHYGSSFPLSSSVLPRMICLEHSNKQSSFPFSFELKTCESLLNLFCNMPRFHCNTKSFSRYSNSIFNIERFLLSILLNHHDESFLYDPFEILRLFVSCRRAMKFLVMGSAEKLGVRELNSIAVFFDCPSSVLWLFKSVYKVAGIPTSFFEGRDSGLVQNMIYSLVDHTSYVFFKISEAKTDATFLFLLKDRFNRDQLPQTRDKLNDNDNSPRSSKTCNDWEHVELAAKALKEYAEKFLVTFRCRVDIVELDYCCKSSEWNEFSSIISCFQALLLGLAFSSDSMLKEMSLEDRKISGLMPFFVSKLSSIVVVFEDLVEVCLNILIFGTRHVAEDFLTVKDDPPATGCDDETTKLYTLIDMPTSSCSLPEQNSLKSASVSTSGNGKLGNFTFRKKRSPASHIKQAINFFHIVNKVDVPKFKVSYGSSLQCLLKDISPQVAFILRQLFITSATILRIKCSPSYSMHLKYQPHSFRPVLKYADIIFATSYTILQEFFELTGKPCEFSFAWLDGVLTFFDVVGSLFSFVDPDISKDVYTHLIDLHLKAMGRCISLQGKTAILSSQDIEFDANIVEEQNATSWNYPRPLEHGKYCLEVFKTKLRMSIKKYIMIQSAVYLDITIQVIERNLLGYRLCTGMDGGMVSSAAAASIECLELILECFSGNIQFIKKNIPSLVGAVINTILHLQNPSIFYAEKSYDGESKVNADAGAVILMCVEVLTKIAGRRAFHMDPCHVHQCFHIPMMCFVGFHKLKASRLDCNFSDLPCNEGKYPLAGRQLNFVDHHYAVVLYTSCCRLMCSTLKNQKRQAERCIPLLEESVSTMLSCLEVVDSDTAKRDGFFSWELPEAIKCASFLRRIYEEIRQQKDALGKYAYLLLSNYISTFSGCGPAKAGIRREIDEALRPGVYSLIDICTRVDLQRLHSLLNEGPCRSTLATLLHDYQQNFQYEGKI